MSANSKFFFKPAPGEQIETRIKINISTKSSIHGTVVDSSDIPVSGAMVLLFRTGEDGQDMALISSFYTDEDGLFVFGNLDSDLLYMIKVFFGKEKIRELEIKPQK